MLTPPTEHDDLDTITSIALLCLVAIAALAFSGLYYAIKFLMTIGGAVQ